MGLLRTAATDSYRGASPVMTALLLLSTLLTGLTLARQVGPAFVRAVGVVAVLVGGVGLLLLLLGLLRR